jgi:hypothetical protein
MADAADFVLAVYNEHMAQARWHEEQREKVSALAFAGSSVLLTLGANGSQGQRYLAYALVVGLGLLGATIALKHYERNRRHVRLGRSLRQRLDLLLPDASVGSILQVTPTLESGGLSLHRRYKTLCALDNVEPVQRKSRSRHARVERLAGLNSKLFCRF